MLNPLVDCFCFTPQVALRVSVLELAGFSRERLEALRASANAGKPTGSDQDEYEAFIEALDLLAILRLKARNLASESE